MVRLPNNLHEFIARYPLVLYEEKMTITEPSTHQKEVFFLQSGKVSLVDTAAKGDEFVLLPLETRSIFPLHCLMSDVTNRYIYKCETRTYVRKIPRKALQDYINEHPYTQRYVLNYLSHRVDVLLTRILYMASASAAERLKYELAFECKMFGKHTADGSCTVEIKNNQLARRTGLKPETVSRELKN